MSTYKICSRCVMDTTDPDIVFDENGVCSHCHQRDEWMASIPLNKPNAELLLEEKLAKIKNYGKNKPYDCLLGVSGGVDSSYMALLCNRYGLRPLIVHFDNGWNSELAVKNIENIMNVYGFDLQTFVMDWDEFRVLQRSFIKAGVVDIEMLTDQAIVASVFKIAKQNRIKYVLSGSNFATESHMPRSWLWMKFDAKNVRSICRQFEGRKVKNFPIMGFGRYMLNQTLEGLRYVHLLNYIPYSKTQALEELSSECGWRYYGGKHYESLFTKFYQAYILPEKFGIDKRRVHLSSLVCSGEIRRSQALDELKKPFYSDENDFIRERDYILDKLEFSLGEFEQIMSQSPKSHLDYPSEYAFYNLARSLKHKLRKGH